MPQRLFEFSQRQALLGERGAVRDGVGDLKLIGELAIASARIKGADHPPTRLLALGAAEPFGQKLDEHVGKRAESRNEEDDEAPRPEPAGLGRMDDQRHFDQEQDQSKLHGSPRTATGETLTPPA